MIDVPRYAIVALSAGTTAVTGATFAPEHLTFVAVLATTVGAVAAIIAWIDHRIEKRIADHTESEEELAQARHEEVKKEISHVRELLRLRIEGRLTPVPERED